MYENLCLRRNHPDKALDFVQDNVLDLAVLNTKIVNILKQINLYRVKTINVNTFTVIDTKFSTPSLLYLPLYLKIL